MDKYPVAWGLDIGHSSIKAVKLSRSGSEVTVLGYAIEPLNVPEGGDRDEAVVKGLRALALREDFQNTPVVAALSGRQVLTRSVNIPILNPKNVDKMVELEARQQIPGNFDEIEWGYHLTPSADGSSNDVALFAVRREVTQELIHRCKQSGLNLVGISVSSLALYNFVKFDQVFPEDETVMILDVGAENTDLVLYQGESLWMRTLAVSGNDITKAFMKKFRVSFEEAETLKRQTGDSRQSDKIIKVIEGSLNELTSEVQRSLGFYKNTNASAKLENLVISGSTFRLPGLPEYLAERLRYTINILEDMDKIKVASGMEREHFLHDLQSLGVAVGLCLQATGVAKANVNLMPSQLRIQKLLNTKRWAAVAIIAIIAVAFSVRYVVTSKVLNSNATLASRIKNNADNNANQVKESKALLDQVAPLTNQLSVYAPYGTQKGVTKAVFSSVIETVEALTKELGSFPKEVGTLPDVANKTEQKLQAIYVQKIELPSFDVRAGSPFAPFAQARSVTVEVAIPKVAKPNEVVTRVLAALRALPVPAYLKSGHQGATLFAEVQAIKQLPGTISYYYIDTDHLNDKGDKVAVREEKRVPCDIAVFDCQLSGKAKEAGK